MPAECPEESIASDEKGSGTASGHTNTERWLEPNYKSLQIKRTLAYTQFDETKYAILMRTKSFKQ